ncbi:phosphotransferase family protein [Paenibacillus guangzhouensis]|uniref:phosphotransferase family protein n=1 Tax=Paenibacillus guangzhouensis TaxID=1473112 RepID=UPI001266EE4B|nr:aminoglycoside phosphotransferase family protein [Paenibacillus guangzhouensis]
MIDWMTRVDWRDRKEQLDALLVYADKLTAHDLNQGFEAEVVKLTFGDQSYVLKTWSKHSKPDIGYQYRLLDALSERGLSVSKPLGWGMNPEGDPVLLTTYDGVPAMRVNKKKLTILAQILSAIHQMDVKELAGVQLPKYDFIGYFFPGAEGHPDVLKAAERIAEMADMSQHAIIHADFHLGNILEDGERYTVIDWTNGQLGDPRYDFAWSYILLKIYISERHAEMFRAAYYGKKPIPQASWECFEALACLRWVLLQRYGSVPMAPNTMATVEGILQSNVHLSALTQEFLYRKI